MNEDDEKKLDLIVSELLIPIWIAVPREYKKKYSYSIWTQFESNIKSAAYTDTLSAFLSKIKARFGGKAEWDDLSAAAIARITTFISSADDRTTLRRLRSETALLTLKVRLQNDLRNEKFNARKTTPAMDVLVNSANNSENNTTDTTDKTENKTEAQNENTAI